MSLVVGQEVVFYPAKSKRTMKAVVVAVPRGKQLSIRIAEDPFPVNVQKSQVKACKPTEERVRSSRSEKGRSTSMAAEENKGPTTKELRKEADRLGIPDFETLGRKELAAAVKKARKAEKKNKSEEPVAETKERPRKKGTSVPKTKTSKKKTKAERPASKKTEKPAAKATKAAAASDPANPFRKGSNLHAIAPLLVKGGVREKLAQRLADKVKLHPYSAKTADEVDLNDYDKRILLAAQTLRDKFNYEIVRDGRGLQGTIKAVPPSSNGSTKKASKKTAKAGKR